MNRKISLMNPRYAYAGLFILIFVFGFIYTHTLLTVNDVGHPLGTKDYLYAVAAAAFTIIFDLRILYLYLMPEYAWRSWAAQHNGHYSYPENLFLHPYGLVVDMLEGKDESVGGQFVMMRSIQSVSNWPYAHRLNYFVRRYVVIGVPGDSFSASSRDDEDLKILAAKRYYYKKPSFEEMTALAQGGNPGKAEDPKPA